MSKVYFANSSQQKIGGGWSFIANIKKGLGGNNWTDKYDDADIYFIAGATMVSREEVEKAKQGGKKIVLRVDNVLRNSRNRNSGMPRLKDFAEWADAVVYQSQWAKSVLIPFTKVDGRIIMNSVDESIFRSRKGNAGQNTYLYSRFNRDETKNWEVARYMFQEIQGQYPDAKLQIVGQFSRELVNGNFDFFMGEDYEFLGVIRDPKQMADIYQSNESLIYTYYNDACSNTLIEALMCGCIIESDNYFLRSGGSEEILTQWGIHGREFFYLDRMTREYSEVFNELLS